MHVHASGPGFNGFLGAATLNLYRPDLAAAYPQYPYWHHSGFRLDVGALAPGTYTLYAYAHSVFSGWAPPLTFNVVVHGGPTVNIDTPASTQQPFTLTGVAADPQSVSGPGVSPGSVQVYAHPTNGGAATYLGVATYGLYRPEYAGTQFAYAGWSIPVRGLTGQYTFVAHALGQVGDVWGSGSKVLTVTNQVAWFMDPPFNSPAGTNLLQPFTIRGAVADLASHAGTGISSVQVWAWDPASSTWFAVNPQYTFNVPYGLFKQEVASWGYPQQFWHSGFEAVINQLPPNRVYQLVVYAFSTVSNQWHVLWSNSVGVDLKVAAPVLSPPPGHYTTEISVSATTATPGATIRVTTDGSVPSESSDPYTGPIHLAANATGKLRAFRQDWIPSDVVDAAYTFEVGAPSVTPASGTYDGSVTVNVSPASPQDVVRYRTDGHDPQPTDDVAPASSVLSTNTTVTLRGFRDGWTPSAVVTRSYTFTAGSPAFSLPGGTYSSVMSLVLSSVTPGATIRVTTDGSPVGATSPLYSGPIVLDRSMTVRARTYASGYAESAEIQQVYTFVVPSPTTAPAAGTYSTEQTVSLSAIAGATIHYTTDGSPPTGSSTPYTAPFVVDRTTTVRAVARRTGWSDSAVVTAAFELRAAPVVMQPPPGNHVGVTMVSLASATPGATILYTLDGSIPGQSGTTITYGAPFGLVPVQTVTVRAIATRSGWTSSVMTEGTYTIAVQVLAMPVPSVPPGPVQVGQVVALTSPDAAPIFFTWNGPDPTELSQPYTAPFVITEPVTIRARAFRADAIPSPILTAAYLPQVAAPTISPPGGEYGTSPLVSLATTTAGATIRYTLNGDPPTTSSTAYASPFAVPLGSTLTARGFRDGWAPSDDAVEVYVSNVLPPPFQGTISPVGAAVTGFSTVGGSATFGVTGATLGPGAVAAYRNGAQLNVTSTSSSFSVSGLADGRNRLDVTGEDTAGRPFDLTAVVWAGSRTVTVTVRGPDNSVLPGAQVMALLVAEDAVSVSGTTDTTGRALLPLTPNSESLNVLAWRAGYRVAEAAVSPGQTAVTINLYHDNNNFSSNLDGWTNGAGINAWTLPHSEAFQGWVPCPDCLPRFGIAGDEQAFVPSGPDNDLTVTNKNTAAAQTVSRRFRTMAGTSGAAVRYRFATTEFQSATPRNDTFLVRLVNVTTGASAVDSQNVFSLSYVGDGATAWRTLAVAAQSDQIIEATFTVTNSVDLSYMSIIIVDQAYEQGVQVSQLELYDHLIPPHGSGQYERLSFLSASSHSWFSGRTRVKGTFTVIGGQTDSLQSLTLEVLEASHPTVVRATAPLHSSVTGVLGVPFGTAGVSVTAPRLLFEISSSQFQNIDQITNGTLILRVRATTVAGLTHTRELGRRVTKLVRYSGPNRYGVGRDDTTCIVKPNSAWQSFECGGDSWTVPSIRLDTASLSGVVVNDFSNMNGGFFPDHTSHQQGRDVDVKWAGGPNGNFAVNGTSAARLIDLFNTPAGGQIEFVYVTFPASTAPGSFWQTIRNATVGGVRLIPEDVAQNYESGGTLIHRRGRVRWQPEHTDHFHIRWRDY